MDRPPSRTAADRPAPRRPTPLDNPSISGRGQTVRWSLRGLDQPGAYPGTTEGSIPARLHRHHGICPVRRPYGAGETFGCRPVQVAAEGGAQQMHRNHATTIEL